MLNWVGSVAIAYQYGTFFLLSGPKSVSYLEKLIKTYTWIKKTHIFPDDSNSAILQEIIKYGFFHSIEKMDPKTLVYTNLELFDKKLQSFQEYKKARALYVLEEAKVKTFQNVIPKPSKWKLQSLIGHRIGYYLTDWTKKLCRGEEVSNFILDRIKNKEIMTLIVFFNK